MGRSSSAEEIAVAKSIVGLERRRQPRFGCAGPAEVLALDSRYFCRGSIRDLSLTGCYVMTGSAPLDLVRRADVELSLQVNGEDLSTPARVIMVRPDSGAAFEFLPIDPETRVLLITLIEKLSESFASAKSSQAA